MPSDTDDTEAAPSAAARMPNRPIVARVALEGFGEDDPAIRWERRPLYRVVEVVRDGEGRLRKEGRIWHSDLDHLRRFGRAVASNAASHKVWIADVRGDVIEELPILSPDQRQPLWGGDWQDMPLPPRPPVRKAARARRPAVAERPIPVLADPPFDLEDTPVAAAGSASGNGPESPVPSVEEPVQVDTGLVEIEVILP